jgi:hypothetical protein
MLNLNKAPKQNIWWPRFITARKVCKKQKMKSLILLRKTHLSNTGLESPFLLLADIYSSKGDQFQAKHTLKSLIENYNDNTDGIKADAAKKVLIIENEEKAQQQKAIDSSFQIQIKEQ